GGAISRPAAALRHVSVTSLRPCPVSSRRGPQEPRAPLVCPMQVRPPVARRVEVMKASFRLNLIWTALAPFALGAALAAPRAARADEGENGHLKENGLTRLESEMSRHGDIGAVNLPDMKMGSGIVKEG